MMKVSIALQLLLDLQRTVLSRMILQRIQPIQIRRRIHRMMSQRVYLGTIDCGALDPSQVYLYGVDSGTGIIFQMDDPSQFLLQFTSVRWIAIINE